MLQQSNMEQHSSKVVLITGASSGIGAGIARGFAKCKASLSITGRNEANLKKVAEECKELGASQVLSIVGDLDKKEDIEKIIEKTAEVHGKLDILVNNAGISRKGGIREITWEQFDQVIGTNLKSAVFMTQMALPYLEKTKGNMVNISSTISDLPTPGLLAYGLSKSAMDHLTKTTALELSSKGIRINSVSPGICETNAMSRDGRMSDEERREMYAEMAQKCNPLEQRELTVENVADSVLFLASDAAKMITGVILKVDVGYHLSGKPM